MQKPLRGLPAIVFNVRRPPTPRVIAPTGTFDLARIRAKVGQILCCPRTSQDAGQIEDSDTEKGLARHWMASHAVLYSTVEKAAGMRKLEAILATTSPCSFW